MPRRLSSTHCLVICATQKVHQSSKLKLQMADIFPPSLRRRRRKSAPVRPNLKQESAADPRLGQPMPFPDGQALRPKGCPLTALFESLDPTGKAGRLKRRGNTTFENEEVFDIRYGANYEKVTL